MASNKTSLTDASVDAVLRLVEPARRRLEAQELDRLFQCATGFTPRIWGSTIVGYGRYHYRYKTGREGDFLATGFSPRKAAISVYIMPGYGDFGSILSELGKHRLGKSCLYINKLADIDQTVLEHLIRAGLEDLARSWTIHPE